MLETLPGVELLHEVDQALVGDCHSVIFRVFLGRVFSIVCVCFFKCYISSMLFHVCRLLVSYFKRLSISVV